MQEKSNGFLVLCQQALLLVPSLPFLLPIPDSTKGRGSRKAKASGFQNLSPKEEERFQDRAWWLSHIERSQSHLLGGHSLGESVGSPRRTEKKPARRGTRRNQKPRSVAFPLTVPPAPTFPPDSAK